MMNKHEDQNDIQIESWMYRVPNEYLALLFSITLLLIIGAIFSTLDLYLFLILIVFGLVYVQLSQAQYLGNSVRVHEKQFPEIYEVFKKQALRLGVQKANLYIKQDPYLNAFTLGITTGTVVLTSALVEQLSIKELSFVIAHELGHFKAGHTIISSLINPLGSGNVFANLIFGFWNRKAEYSADRCGLILTKNIDPALSSLIKLSVGSSLFENIDMSGYVAQIKKADTGVVRMSELLIDHPLTTNRIKKLLSFWRDSFKTKQDEMS